MVGLPLEPKKKSIKSEFRLVLNKEKIIGSQKIEMDRWGVAKGILGVFCGWCWGASFTNIWLTV